MDGDRDIDVAISNDRHQQNRIYFNDGKAHFAVAGTFGQADWNSRKVVLADLDADGRPDLVVANDGKGRTLTRVGLGDGRGIVYGIAIGDLNGDGLPDIVAARALASSAVYMNSWDTAARAFGGLDLAWQLIDRPD